MTAQTGEVVGKDPDEIAREIEQTRVELAETIDQLADRLSPRRVAERNVARARERVDQLRGVRPPGRVAGADGTTYEATRRLRPGRVAVVAAALAVAAVTVVVLRRRR